MSEQDIPETPENGGNGESTDPTEAPVTDGPVDGDELRETPADLAATEGDDEADDEPSATQA